MTEDLKAMARARMEADSETAGFIGKSNPVVAHERPDREVFTGEEANLIVSMTFMSRSENNRPHVVTVHADGVTWCTCRASVPCWAIKGFCRATGRYVFP